MRMVFKCGLLFFFGLVFNSPLLYGLSPHSKLDSPPWFRRGTFDPNEFQEAKKAAPKGPQLAELYLKKVAVFQTVGELARYLRENRDEAATYLMMIRHGESEANAGDSLAGRKIDTPLSGEGERQATLAGIFLSEQKIGFDGFVSTGLVRADKTLWNLMRGMKIQNERVRSHIVPALQERDYGVLSGRSKKEVTGTIEPFDFGERDGGEWNPAWGETVEEYFARVKGGYAELIERYSRKVVLIAGHRGVNHVLIQSALGIPANENRRLFTDNASLTVLEISPRGNRLLLYSNTEHLQRKDSPAISVNSSL